MINSSFWDKYDQMDIKQQEEDTLQKIKWETENNPIESDDNFYTRVSCLDALLGIARGYTAVCRLDDLEYRFAFLPPAGFVKRYGIAAITERHRAEGVWYLQEK